MREIYENRIQKLQEVLKNIDKLDRANKINVLSLILTVLRSEVHGWFNWIFDPRVQLAIGDDELTELIKEFGNILLKILELDIKYISKKVEERVKTSEGLRQIIEFAESYGYSYDYYSQLQTRISEEISRSEKKLKELDRLYA